MMYVLKMLGKLYKIFKSKQLDGVVYCSFMTRYLSIITDLLLLYVIMQIVPYVFGKFAYYYAPTLEAIEKYKLHMDMSSEETQSVKIFFYVTYAIQIVEMILVYLYSIFFWIKFGGTPSKLFMGIRVVSFKTLEPMNFKQANKRFFSYPLSLLPLALGILWGAIDKKSQMLHDKIADTIVIQHKKNIETDSFDMLCNKFDMLCNKIIIGIKSRII